MRDRRPPARFADFVGIDEAITGDVSARRGSHSAARSTGVSTGSGVHRGLSADEHAPPREVGPVGVDRGDSEEASEDVVADSDDDSDFERSDGGSSATTEDDAEEDDPESEGSAPSLPGMPDAAGRRRQEPRGWGATAGVVAFNIGDRLLICEHCNALKFRGERNSGGICCLKGKSAGLLHVFSQAAPQPLRSLLTTYPRNRQAGLLMRQIRLYNSSLSMASSGIQVRCPPRGTSMLRIQGGIYHLMSALRSDDAQPTFSQIYVIDAAEAQLDARMQAVGRDLLDRQLLLDLQGMLLHCNRFARRFRQVMQDVDPDTMQRYSVRFRDGPSGQERRYNAPVADEIGVIIENTEPVEGRDIVVRLAAEEGHLQRISDLNSAYDPLHFVLFYPRGEHGWSPDMQLSNGRALTPMNYAAYFMNDRADQHALFVHGGRLYAEWILDAYVKVERHRLNWIRTNQNNIRSGVVNGLEDAVAAGERDASRIGRLVVLPSSFSGGPRSMLQHFQDAMGLVRVNGKPDYFITMTCNPKWPEIQRCLLSGQTANDRPDVVARVFHLKMQQLLKELRDGILGKPKSLVWVVEFQKRGLPHVHILLTVEDQYKPREEDVINKVVWAVLPDEAVDPELYRAVVSYMLHGPCGAAFPRCACMNRGRCTKKYPKQFRDQTTVEATSYPEYRRPDDGRRHEGQRNRGFAFDNRWVVPYNPYLLKRFDCHINVEVVTQLTAVKYTFKYIHKGHDRAEVEIGDPQQRDEIRDYVEGRYVSASEASWRLYGFHLCGMWPSVHRLPVHLPGENWVFWRGGDLNEQALQERRNRSKLVQWFEYNRRKREEYQQALQDGQQVLEPAALRTLYPDVCSLAVWDQRAHRVPGAESFEHLRTVDGVVHPTFREACRARGLLVDDEHWIRTMEDLAVTDMPSQLRQTFAHLLLYNVQDAVSFWRQFRASLSEDFVRRSRDGQLEGGLHEDEGDVWSEHALVEIAAILGAAGRSLESFGLPTPQIQVRGRVVDDELARYDAEEEGRFVASAAPSLNADQRTAYDALLSAIERPNPTQSALFFLDGIGGAGKTFLYKVLLAHVRSHGDIALACASSGLAALLLPGGRTGHARFKIPIEVQENTTCYISRESDVAELIRTAKLIVWDEAPMMHRHVFEAVDRTLKDICGCDRPFGGKVVVLGGDFRQCLPVIPKGTKTQIVEASLSRSPLWRHVRVLRLHRNMRVQVLRDAGDAQAAARLAEFASMLKRLGEGMTSNDGHWESTVQLPQSMLFDGSELEFVAVVFGGWEQLDCQEARFRFLSSRCILAPTNRVATRINDLIVDQHVLGEEGEQVHVLLSTDMVEEEDQALAFPEELLHTLDVSGLPPHQLKLQPGSPVVALKSLPPYVVNGTRLIVVSVEPRVLRTVVLSGPNVGRDVLIPRLTLTASDSTALGFTLRRTQFPVRVAYAMTINKAQGLTLEKVGVHLSAKVFTHGQLYVALSRVGSPDGVVVHAPAAADGRVHNVVYREALI